MNREELKRLLQDVYRKKLSPEEGFEKLSDLPFVETLSAKLDTHRALRSGISEVIYGENKTLDQLREVIGCLSSKKVNIFSTRIEADIGKILEKEFEGSIYDTKSRTFQMVFKKTERLKGRVAVCCAGTADISVAEEAVKTLNFFGVSVERFYDVGVAGLHRLLSKKNSLRKKDVLIVVAGMEGALSSVVGGLFSQPIIAVPTSVGYGVSFNGLNALLSMLGSCAEGISVVNIDSGFGAACSAFRIINLLSSSDNIR